MNKLGTIAAAFAAASFALTLPIAAEAKPGWTYAFTTRDGTKNYIRVIKRDRMFVYFNQAIEYYSKTKGKTVFSQDNMTTSIVNCRAMSIDGDNMFPGMNGMNIIDLVCPE